VATRYVIILVFGMETNSIFNRIVFGENKMRFRIFIIQLSLLIFLTLAFVVNLVTNSILGIFSMVFITALACSAGWYQDGLVSAIPGIFVVVLWWYVIPPTIGILQGVERNPPSRYTVPSLDLGQPLSLSNELWRGLQEGPLVALLVGLTLGGFAYASGCVVRRGVTGLRDHRSRNEA